MPGYDPRKWSFVTPKWMSPKWLSKFQDRVYTHAGPAKVLEITERGVVRCRRKYGEDSPVTVRAMANLATLYQQQGEPLAALEVEERVVTLRRKNLGTEDLRTVESEFQYAKTLFDLQRYDEALPLFAHGVTVRRDSFGEDSPETISAMAWLGRTMSTTGDHDAAIAILRRTAELAVTLKEDASFTLDVQGNLALALAHADQLDEAIQLERHILDSRIQMMGEDDPNTSKSLWSLSVYLLWAGQTSEAKVLARSLVERQSRVLGANHSETIIAQQLLDDIESAST